MLSHLRSSWGKPSPLVFSDLGGKKGQCPVTISGVGGGKGGWEGLSFQHWIGRRGGEGEGEKKGGKKGSFRSVVLRETVIARKPLF